MDRSMKAARNSSVAAVSQVITLILGFVLQAMLVKNLGSEYVGLNGLFSNILTILAFTELGIGNAIAFSLYKPLKENDYIKVSGIMAFFKKVYITVGLVIIILSFVLTPFLDLLIDGTKIDHTKLFFLIYAFNTAATYFMSYKSILLIADQQGYFNNLANLFGKVIVVCLQFVALINHSYVFFLLAQIIGTMIINIIITRKATKEYRKVFEIKNAKLNKNDVRTIGYSTLGVMGQKIGSIAVNNTNNLFLSSFVGLFTTGIYSSYMLVINGATTVINQFMNAAISSIGNLGTENNKKKMDDVLNHHMFLSWTVAFFSSVFLYTCLSPFVKIWLGADYVFGLEITVLLILNYYINQTRLTFMSFIQAQGLFKAAGIKSIIEAMLNIVACVIFLKIIGGVQGLLIATIIINIVVNISAEPYIVYKFGIEKKMSLKFYFMYVLNGIVTISVGYLAGWVCEKITAGGILEFVERIIVTVAISIPIYLLYVYKNKSFHYFMIYISKTLKINMR